MKFRSVDPIQNTIPYNSDSKSDDITDGIWKQFKWYANVYGKKLNTYWNILEKTKHFARFIPICGTTYTMCVCMYDFFKVYVKNALCIMFGNENHIRPMMIVYCLNVNNRLQNKWALNLNSMFFFKSAYVHFLFVCLHNVTMNVLYIKYIVLVRDTEKIQSKL